MRIRYLLCATLALAPDGISHAATDDSQLEEIVVTARRAPEPRLNFAGSLSRLNAQAIDLEGATHYSELLNRVPGVYVQRGSGQESLVAIRSPVLNGAGACGAFLMLEDGLPIRPVGFCNVNEMFELNTEQADAIEVIRGPGPAIYGANAMHGIVNVITPAAKELSPLAVALEGGTNDYKRVKFKTSTDTIGAGAGMYGLYTNDGGYRANSGDEEGKVNLLADTQLGSGTLRIRGAGTLLNQRTAGFVQGFDAYGNPALRTSNPNPEAFRDAWSTRLAAHWTSEPCSGCSEALHAIVRRSRMRFLQHFLLGEPLEDNSQTSFEVSGAVSRPLPGRLDAQIGLDAEAASTDLLEVQGSPTVGGTPAARAIRPAGRHYDYTVAARTAGLFAALEFKPSQRWRFESVLRLEQTRYAYENHMISGNTDQNGVPCPFGGCLYSRPASRDDRFNNVAPKLDASYSLTDHQRLYAMAARGFRPPEITEVYRLQRQQSAANLESERLDSVELGWLGERRMLRWSVAAYALEKRNAILRDSSGFNVSNGRTSHRGFEYELRAQPSERVQLIASGSVAWHRYEFSEAVDGGDTITKGNTVATAPRNVHNLAVGFQPTARTAAEVELNYLGGYFLDASNQHTYPGHTLANARVRYALAPGWKATLRVTNLLDRRYADRADYAFGNYRYFPGRERSGFLEIGYDLR